jgi:hypothetical protein
MSILLTGETSGILVPLGANQPGGGMPSIHPSRDAPAQVQAEMKAHPDLGPVL